MPHERAQSPVPRAQSPVGGLASGSPQTPKPKAPVARPIKKHTKGDEVYIGQTLNNRFKIESKIGEGGFGAVYRGVQLATGRKVALKLLHPEMTKDENLVARFRREGMVLCNLRDAHTITTYDFDATPDGTLYIAMELLEGKSLHQVFHAEAPLEWKRTFKILIEMCSSLAEAHQQGIVHRDLKPENVYLESRPGNPEFVKILDFGIAKVMRGDSIDPQSPQLTATGQTLGTLEYMSPEQLMGKQLDGRSDVYALGVVAYEMITGRLPFPDAKGPAGLITAQLKQTPQPPSAANPKVNIPPAADRVILKALEKAKDNRFPDVSAMAGGMQEVLDQAKEASNPLMQPLPASSSGGALLPPELADAQAGQSLAGQAVQRGMHTPAVQRGMHTPGVVQRGMQTPGPSARTPNPYGAQPPQQQTTPSPYSSSDSQGVRMGTPPPAGAPQPLGFGYPQPYGDANASGGTPQPQPKMQMRRSPLPAPPVAHPQQQQTTQWIWWVVGLLVLGAAIGAVLAFVMR